MELLRDIYRFYCYLSLVDIIFLVAVITLLILVVTLVYFIKINRDDKNDSLPTNYEVDEQVNMNTDDNNLELVEEYNDEENAILDMKALENKIKEELSNKVSITDYEKDQEDKAIISYDELVEKHNKYAINYENEQVFDDLVIKKVDLNDLENKNIVDNLKNGVTVLSYQKEEDFLKALKELNSLLN